MSEARGVGDGDIPHMHPAAVGYDVAAGGTEANETDPGDATEV